MTSPRSVDRTGPADSSLAEDLATVVGPSNCLTDPGLTAGYERDWTGRFSGTAALVVRPGTTAEVAEVLRTCGRHGAAVVPQGGNTGLVGGSVPRGGEVVVSLRRLDRIERCDPVDGRLLAGAGTTLATAERAAAGVGMTLGIDLAARDSATLGGMVATNAGGLHVVRYGPMRSRLVGVEAVLADGTVASRLLGLVKDNVGPDLPSLLCGSEGTLAVVTAVLLRLESVPPRRATALVALAGDTVGDATSSAVELSRALRREVDGVEALELVTAAGMAIVRGHAGLARPPEPAAAAWLLVEAASAGDPAAAIAGALEAASGCWRGEPAVALDGPARSRLWAYRERLTEAIASVGIPHKLDVTLPMGALAGFVGAVEDAVSAIDGARAVCFGHVGDGNVHVNVLGPPPDDGRVDDLVLDLVLADGGSISAEHGVGIAKLGYVTRARGAGDLEVLRRVKDALDPTGMLNPGVLFPPR